MTSSNEPRRIVITGTDTEIGKTFVGCAVARAAVKLGFRVVGIKPVESGCDDLAVADRDGRLLALATGQHSPREALQSFGPPVAPPVAAKRAGVRLDQHRWLEQIRRAEKGADLLLVEGAGGLLSPLTEEENIRDLALVLDAAAILVGADRLGTLNHVLLTVESLSRAGIGLEAIVLSAPERTDASTGNNRQELVNRLSCPVFELPRCSPAAAVLALGSLAAQLCTPNGA